MQKKLYSSRDERMIWGVAGGMGKYFGIEPTIIRVIWVLSLIFGWFSIPAYIIVAIIIPLEPQETG